MLIHRVITGTEEVPLKSDPTRTRPIYQHEYRWQDGRRVTEEVILERIRSYVLPPAIPLVHIDHTPGAKLQARWIDDKGRTQRKYSKSHTRTTSQEKFSRLEEFVPVHDLFLTQVRSDLTLTLPVKRQCAQILYLIYVTGFRIGSRRDTGGEVQAYGASTLRSMHVRVNGTGVAFNFIGKKGARIRKEADDPLVYRLLKERKEWAERNRSTYLFTVSDSDARSYLAEVNRNLGVEVLIKDLRMYRAWVTAVAAVRDLYGEQPARSENMRKFRKAQLQVAEIVAEQLQNTRAVCLSKYIPFAGEYNVWKDLLPEGETWMPKDVSEPSGDE